MLPMLYFLKLAASIGLLVVAVRINPILLSPLSVLLTGPLYNPWFWTTFGWYHFQMWCMPSTMTKPTTQISTSESFVPQATSSQLDTQPTTPPLLTPSQSSEDESTTNLAINTAVSWDQEEGPSLYLINIPRHSFSLHYVPEISTENSLTLSSNSLTTLESTETSTPEKVVSKFVDLSVVSETTMVKVPYENMSLVINLPATTENGATGTAIITNYPSQSEKTENMFLLKAPSPSPNPFSEYRPENKSFELDESLNLSYAPPGEHIHDVTQNQLAGHLHSISTPSEPPQTEESTMLVDLILSVTETLANIAL